MHFLTPFFSQQVLAEAFAEGDATVCKISHAVGLFHMHTLNSVLIIPCTHAAVDTGLVEAVGVCNYDTEQLREFHSLMAARGIPVASNQVPAECCWVLLMHATLLGYAGLKLSYYSSSS